jgi:hypothetical protein
VQVIGRRQAGTLPSPEYIGVTEGSYHDGKIFDQIRPELINEGVFGDKTYQRPDAKEIQELQNLNVLTPVKKEKGQKHLDVDEQWLSTAVSKVRQPIETLFDWIEKNRHRECRESTFVLRTHASCVWKACCCHVFLEKIGSLLLIHIKTTVYFFFESNIG